jgi:hypothetical protein
MIALLLCSGASNRAAYPEVTLAVSYLHPSLFSLVALPYVM